MAGPGDELSPGVEEPLDRLGHRVERSAHLRELASALLGCTGGEIAGGELCGGCAQPLEWLHDPAGEQQRPDDGGQRRSRRDGEDLGVVVHVEHDPAGGQNPAEGEDDREECEPGELQADGRQQPEQKRRDDPDGDGAEREEDRDLGHGVNR